jgi:hypothetical protein
MRQLISKNAIFFVFFILMGSSSFTSAQGGAKSIPLVGSKALSAVNVVFSEETYKGRRCLLVTEKGADSNPEMTFVTITSASLKDGIIELDVAGKPAEGAISGARGFIGVAFRLNEDNSKYECFYLRPTNGRADDQVRRNHSVQYISFPDFPWQKLRKEFPEKYESYADLEVGEWTKVKIVVEGGVAKLYVHGNSQPTLIVNDLKHGPGISGRIALWIGPGTEGRFSNLVVTEK